MQELLKGPIPQWQELDLVAVQLTETADKTVHVHGSRLPAAVLSQHAVSLGKKS